MPILDRELVLEPAAPRNCVTLEGYLEEHPELRFDRAGIPYVTLRIVVDSPGFDFSIKRPEEPGVVVRVMIGQKAYEVNELDKGTRVFVGGKAYPQMWSLGGWDEWIGRGDPIPVDVEMWEIELSACRDAAKESDSLSQ